MTDPFRTNRLGDETSPYLQQHKDNPVHWQAWSQEALDYAKSQDKPILLSIGYAACHWCHVMAHESFENPEIAALMNDNFVNIKIDREERPDIDNIYMNALILFGSTGGWPLTMFLDPSGKPFWGGTYYPPEPRYGRQAFPDLLNRVVEVYKTDKATITRNTSEVTARLLQTAATPTAGPMPAQALTDVASAAFSHLDRRNGGIGQAPKFPQPYVFDLLWRAFFKTSDNSYYKAVVRTLDHICQGGIYDHLGGGFARYSVDAQWLVPHFEKMLYDNALLLSLLTKVWQDTRSELYETRIRETVAWVMREMVTDSGAFAASLDADSEGEEGKYYVWTEPELQKLLAGLSDTFFDVYDVTPAGNWEGKTILNRLKSKDKNISPQDTAKLHRARGILLEARSKRVRPGWDDKVLTDWNGLMIAALAEAGAVFAESSWIAAARKAFETIATKLAVSGAPNRLHHSYRNSDARHVGLLDDYADMAWAALALFDATGESSYIDHAQRWMDTLEAHYADTEHGGYFHTADDAEALIARMRSAVDNATPSGNAVAAMVLGALYHLTGEAKYRERADKIFAAFGGDLARTGIGFSTLASAYEAIQRAVAIVLVGARGDAKTATMIRAVRNVSLPAKTLQVVAPGESLPEGHPAAGKADEAAAGTAYVCVDNSCSIPITDAETLTQTLIVLRAGGTLGAKPATEIRI